VLGGPLEDTHFAGEAVERGYGRALPTFNGGSRGDEAVDHPGEWAIELRREKGEQLLPHVQTERRLSACEVGRCSLAARERSRRAKADGDLDDQDRFDEQRDEREEIVAQDAEPRRRQEQNVRPDCGGHRRQQARTAASVPRRDDHRCREKHEWMTGPEPVEEVLDRHGDRYGRDGDCVAAQDPELATHRFRSISAAVARVGLDEGSVRELAIIPRDRLMSEELALWHDFNVALVTAAAGLLGLLFVALSIHIRALSDRRNAELRSVARSVFLGYVVALAFGFLALLPQSLVWFGVEIFLLNLLAIVPFSAAARSGLRASGVGYSRNVTILQFLAGFGLFATALVAAIGVAVGATWALFLIASLAVIALLWGVFNTWELIFRMQGVGSPAE